MKVIVYMPADEKTINEFRKKVSLIHSEKIINYLKSLKSPCDCGSILRRLTDIKK